MRVPSGLAAAQALTPKGADCGYGPRMSANEEGGPRRLDVELVRRGLAASRAAARAAIEAGKVRVGGVAAAKPGQTVTGNAAIEAEPAHPWVSRGGLKLAHALDVFAIDPAGRMCLDIGASTGGFTDVLLSRGARRVAALDVGRDQFSARLRADSRVTSFENTDARKLTLDMVGERPTLIVCDLSFISSEQGARPAVGAGRERGNTGRAVQAPIRSGAFEGRQERHRHRPRGHGKLCARIRDLAYRFRVVRNRVEPKSDTRRGRK